MARATVVLSINGDEQEVAKAIRIAKKLPHCTVTYLDTHDREPVTNIHEETKEIQA